jgi:hypothetical protein
MYKKNRKKSSSSRKLLVSMGLVAAALAAVVGIILGINQFLSNGVEATLANLGIADSITANQKVLESIPIEFEVPNSYRSSTLKEVATSEKVVALTFDDGPWPQTTEAILDTLKKKTLKQLSLSSVNRCGLSPKLLRKWWLMVMKLPTIPYTTGITKCRP